MPPAPGDPNRKPFPKEWLMLMALIVGLIYLFLPPPWQQNDESTQFEYVWLVAHRDHWPQPGDMDVQMRRDVMGSMIDHRFFHQSTQPPQLDDFEDPINIGVSQLEGMPLYYFLASLPLRLFPNVDITLQLYMARLVSVTLFVVLVYFVIQTTNLLFGNHLLGWMITIFVALLPQLAYRMTAVNDDAAAIASMTFFVWMSARILKLGPNWKNVLGICTAMVLCVLSKPTAWLAVPFGILAILLAFFRTRPMLVWGGMIGLIVLAVLLVFEWQAALPAEFYQYNSVSRRIQPPEKVEGEYAFLTSKQQNGFYQVLDKKNLTKQTETTDGMVTFGVWVWSNENIEVPPPMLLLNGENVLPYVKVQVSKEPVFISAQAQVLDDYRTPVLRVLSENLPEDTKVYWDCLILIPGEHSDNSLPKTNNNCSHIEWDGYTGKNIIRNASAERGWFPLRENVAKIVSRFYKLQITDFWAVFDPTTSQVYYQDAIGYIFRTFWGRFNWGTLGLAGQRPYRVFVILSALAVLGNGIAAWRYRRIVDWNLLFFFLFLVAADLAYTLVRFSGSWNRYYSLLPQARYFFPVILPSAFFICAGWYALLKTPLKVMKFPEKFPSIFIGLFLGYNTWAWYTIWAYWYR